MPKMALLENKCLVEEGFRQSNSGEMLRVSCVEKERRDMAKEKLVKNITPRDENFAQWYTDVVHAALDCDYSSVKGCLNYLPNGYAIWELIQADLDKRFKETGVENVYLPMLIPENLLEKEAEHVEGFAPEVAMGYPRRNGKTAGENVYPSYFRDHVL